MYRLIVILSCFLLISFPCHANSDDDGYFDYRETTTIVLYKPYEEGAWFLSRPFAEGLPDTGKRFYQMTLPYLLKLEEITFPLPDPLYYFDFLSDNGMKRFSVGERWIATEGRVTFVTNESHWNAIEHILRTRVENEEAESEHFEKSMIAERYLYRMISNGISKDTENRSLREAIDSIGSYVDPYDHVQDIEDPTNNEAGVEYQTRTILESGAISEIGSTPKVAVGTNQSAEVEATNLDAELVTTTDFESREAASSLGTFRRDDGPKVIFFAFIVIFVLLLFTLGHKAYRRRIST